MRWWLLLALLVIGCSKTPQTAPTIVVAAPPAAFSPSLLVDLGMETAESSRMPQHVLISEDPNESRALLWNGIVGVNVGPDGTGHDLSGTPLPSFNYSSFDKRENIEPLQSMLDVSIQANGAPLKLEKAGYWQTLDMRYGLLTTHWFAAVKGGFLEARLSNVLRDQALLSRWEFRAPAGTKLDVIRRSTSTTTDSGWNTDVRALVPELISDDATGEVPAKQIDKGGTDSIVMTKGRATWLSWKGLQLASSKWFLLHPKSLKPALLANHADLASKSLAEIEIDGPLPDQQVINSFFYYLETSVPKAGRMQISPFALSSNLYNGHVFWDADVWVMPALAFIEPQVLQGQVDYRLRLMQKAPNAPFPWESSITGRETAPGESTKEIHISGSVLWGLEFAKALGAKVPDGVPKRVADYYLGRAAKELDGTLSLVDVMSPDESHIGSNDLYTNLVAQWAINGATWRPAKPSAQLKLPRDATSFLTYDGDQLRKYKQAAALLSIYPLQYPLAEAEAATMLERFQSKISATGPAMSDSIHAIISARLGDADRGYDLWKKSWTEFVKGPHLLFSEKRTSPRTYFTTGAAGCLQSVIYGFLGLRVDETPLPGAAWSHPLKDGRWLSIKPNLPSAWKSATFRNFHVLGTTYTLTVKREGSKTVTSVQQGD